MHLKRRRRLIAILVITLTSGLAVVLVLLALWNNVNLYYTPTEVLSAQLTRGQVIRLGGFVKPGSVVKSQTDLRLSFLLSDGHHSVNVVYVGVLPMLFRDGQGAVVSGNFLKPGIFQATELLAKHDQKYQPFLRRHS